jgi:hypothetical protein
MPESVCDLGYCQLEGRRHIVGHENLLGPMGVPFIGHRRQGGTIRITVRPPVSDAVLDPFWKLKGCRVQEAPTGQRYPDIFFAL